MNEKLSGSVKSKTMWVSVALMAVGLLQQLDVAALIPSQYVGIAAAGVGLVVAVLRWVTTHGLDEK